MKAFLTGSQAYGQPGQRSDVDLVVPISAEAMWKLAQLADNASEIEEGLNRQSGGQHTPSLRFGDLNLICVLAKHEWQLWKQGTRILLEKSEKHGPISRGTAKRLFDRMRYEDYSATDAANVIDWSRNKRELEKEARSNRGPWHKRTTEDDDSYEDVPF